MMQAGTFRTRPAEVQAMQWDSPESTEALIDWAGQDIVGEEILEWDESVTGPVGPEGEDWGELRVETLEGYHVASPYDWLIRGVAGEFFFCKPGVFDATYQEVTP